MLQSILLTAANFGSKKGTGHIRCFVAVFVQEYFFYERISLFLDEQRHMPSNSLGHGPRSIKCPSEFLRLNGQVFSAHTSF